jgi:hypothetical protein
MKILAATEGAQDILHTHRHPGIPSGIRGASSGSLWDPFVKFNAKMLFWQPTG